MDYAKRAAKLVQCESNNGYWLTSIDGRYLADGHGENAADVTEQIRAWLAAELQAAHDAGVAEAAPKYRFMVDRAANEKLDGYRELGEKAAHAERERDAWHQVARMWELLARKGADLVIDIEKLYHPDSDNEEIGALVVWSESVRDLPSVEDVRGSDADAKKETEK